MRIWGGVRGREIEELFMVSDGFVGTAQYVLRVQPFLWSRCCSGEMGHMNIPGTLGSPLLDESRRSWTWVARAVCHLRVQGRGNQKRGGQPWFEGRSAVWLSLPYVNRNVRLILGRAPAFGLETLARGLEVGGSPAGRRERGGLAASFLKLCLIQAV